MPPEQIIRHLEQLYTQHFLQFPPFRLEEGRVVGRFFKYRLTSVFYPVVSLIDHEIVGWRAILQSTLPDGQWVDPSRLFALAFDNSGLVNLDRLVRTLHVANALLQRLDGALFLDVHPRLLGIVKDDHGRFFEQVLQQFEVSASHIVIHLPSGTQSDATLLAKSIANYRQRGYQVAASSDLPALSRLAYFAPANRPELVTLTFAGTVPHELGAWRKQASLSGMATLVWHVDSHQQLAAAHEARVDFATGQAVKAVATY
ncbi:EAL domain-containing protein (putative c-di-GMP-specific phosphodiesterase class I) [Chitinivorax tropicus]|uniref:EAL domain-containing protein (Putative c-di-GMP-specific phosphodiesterase class I) n=1 Tax=Chitinivorax tropicus TaxID=714531 RepID=A0A840MT66_9PROT|nr:EAL domain-containing protein [Chitinivorax tropicus]MBB5019972.1 EAL domain-containing protein (putative c-di-GMP-specific phosphodiesterase class I) [Chitinivorax tropicus]